MFEKNFICRSIVVLGHLVSLTWHQNFPKQQRLLSSFTDSELWNASVLGNREAFGLLFKRHYSQLFQYGIKICNDAAALEDAIQELFAELWNKKTTQPIQSVKAYLFQALKYKLYKSFRNRKPVVDLEQNSDEVFEFSHETFLIQAQDDDARIKKILEAINQLPVRQKEIIYLKIYKGLSYEEISDIMQINYQVVRNLLCQALKTFRKLIIPIIVILSSLQ